jgi:TGS domain
VSLLLLLLLCSLLLLPFPRSFDFVVESKAIKITLPDGSVREGVAGETTPLSVAQSISQGLAQAVVVSRVNDKVWDLQRPLEGDCTLELVKFDSDEGRDTFWHSSAHILGWAMEKLYGAHLTHGPPNGDGFFYDGALPHGCVSDYLRLTSCFPLFSTVTWNPHSSPLSLCADVFALWCVITVYWLLCCCVADVCALSWTVDTGDLKLLDLLVKSFAKKKAPFQRIVATKDEALDLFSVCELF